MPKLLNWLDQHLLTLIAGFLLVFIPLYPKWPLFDILPGYNVRVRLEDVLILIANFYFIFQVVRKKIKIQSAPLFKPILIYLTIGLLSTLSAIFITKTVYPEWIQIAKVFLHWFRRIEYFSLFFIFYFALKNLKTLKVFICLLMFTVFSVSIYGFGQKYLYWPAYSTMNREFSKGIALYLTEHARVLSTFGGHFDLAGYIVITLIPLIIISLVYEKKWIRYLSLLVSVFEYWLLILTASRTSWVAYIIGISAAFFLMFFKKRFFWVFSRWLVVISLSFLIMISFGDLSERFSHILKLEGVKEIVLRPFRSPPKNGLALNPNLSLEEQLSIIATRTDIPPSSERPPGSLPDKPLDVYDDTYEKLQAYLATVSGETFNINYSENALRYGLSAGIRLDTLWPNAVRALKINPLLGTGYSTLVKSKVWEFTIAESTDNDYLRLLGETGILGFASFILILGVVLKTLYRAFRKSTRLLDSALFGSGIAITIGLLANAIYIDVFEASKIAYSYWSIIGLLLALATHTLKHDKKTA
ncbi:MAG: O-antigen ligase family protein [Candidatus Beckwithbacteria bacterium]